MVMEKLMVKCVRLNPGKIYKMGATTKWVADPPKEGLVIFTEKL
jgi:hypothetical protein